MSNSAGRILLVLLILGSVTLTSLWFLSPDNSVRISGVDSGQTVEIIGIRRHLDVPGGVTLANGNLQVPIPVEFEIPARLLGKSEVEIIGGPGAPISVEATDKFGQTFRARGERVVVWQGPLASGGVSAGRLRAVFLER